MSYFIQRNAILVKFSESEKIPEKLELKVKILNQTSFILKTDKSGTKK